MRTEVLNTGNAQMGVGSNNYSQIEWVVINNK